MSKKAYLIQNTWNLQESTYPRSICTTIKDFVSVMTDLANEHRNAGYMYYEVFIRDANMSDTVKKSNSKTWSFYREEFKELQAMNGEGPIVEKTMRKFLKKHDII